MRNSEHPMRRALNAYLMAKQHLDNPRMLPTPRVADPAEIHFVDAMRFAEILEEVKDKHPDEESPVKLAGMAADEMAVSIMVEQMAAAGIIPTLAAAFRKHCAQFTEYPTDA